MTTFRIGLILLIILNFLFGISAQDIDTLVDIGTQKMHFNIWQGTGTPILFESGGGNDASIWSSLVDDIHSITGATIITYDRVGYGQSGYNPNLADDKKALISNAMEALVSGLQKLKMDKELMIVGHSYGGYGATYLAANYPSMIVGIVLLDSGLTCYYTDERLAEVQEERTDEWYKKIRSLSEAVYYESLSFPATIKMMRNYSIPTHVPVLNLVAENPPFEKTEDDESWKTCHAEFVQNNENVSGMIAHNCGHYLHFDHPKLAVDAVVSMFSEVNTEINQQEILKRYLTYSTDYSNNYRQREYEYWHSENDFNNWGYALIEEKNLPAALKVLELNTILYPDAFNVWDSYGEILLLMGQEQAAKKMYQKSLDLNPENENAIAVLKRLEE